MNKSEYKSQLDKLQKYYNTLSNIHYITNPFEIEDLITYPTLKMIKSYLVNFISNQGVDYGDYEDFFDVDINNLIEDILNYLFYGFCAFEIIYSPKVTDGRSNPKNSLIAVSDLNLIHYRLINRNVDVLTDKGLKVSNDITLPNEKFMWLNFNNPYPFGISLLSKDVVKLICEGREQFINQSYYMYRLANPTIWQKIENATSENKVLNILSKIRTGLAGITIGENDEIGVLSEGSKQGELFNDSIYNIDKKISSLMFFPYQLIDRNGVGSYNQSENESKIFHTNVNGFIRDINSFFKKLCKKIAIVNNLNNTLDPISIGLISEDNEQLVLDYLKEFVKPSDNEEFYNDFTKEWLDRNMNYDLEDELVFKSTVEPIIPNADPKPNDEEVEDGS